MDRKELIGRTTQDGGEIIRVIGRWRDAAGRMQPLANVYHAATAPVPQHRRLVVRGEVIVDVGEGGMDPVRLKGAA